MWPLCSLLLLVFLGVPESDSGLVGGFPGVFPGIPSTTTEVNKVETPGPNPFVKIVEKAEEIFNVVFNTKIKEQTPEKIDLTGPEKVSEAASTQKVDVTSAESALAERIDLSSAAPEQTDSPDLTTVPPDTPSTKKMHVPVGGDDGRVSITGPCVANAEKDDSDTCREEFRK